MSSGCRHGPSRSMMLVMVTSPIFSERIAFPFPLVIVATDSMSIRPSPSASRQHHWHPASYRHGKSPPAPPFLFGPAEPPQVAAIPVVELDAFLFQQALLERIAAIAGRAVGHLALRVDNAMPGNIGCQVEVLEQVADKTGAPRQTGHCSDLSIGGNPALWNPADHSTNRRGGFVASVRGSPKQLALCRRRQLSSDSRRQKDTHSAALPRPGANR